MRTMHCSTLFMWGDPRGWELIELKVKCTLWNFVILTAVSNQRDATEILMTPSGITFVIFHITLLSFTSLHFQSDLHSIAKRCESNFFLFSFPIFPPTMMLFFVVCLFLILAARRSSLLLLLLLRRPSPQSGSNQTRGRGGTESYSRAEEKRL